MTQAGALALVTGPEAEPRAEAQASRYTLLRLAVPLLLAAGWGALLTFSTMFLLEDGRGPSASGRLATRLDDAAPFGPAPSRLRDPDRITETGAIRLVGTTADAVPPMVPASVAPAPPSAGGPAAGLPAERPDYVGTWGPTAQACGRSRHGYLPARISEDGARAGRTLCRFRDGRRDGIAWAVSAECSERGRRWTSQVRLLVDGDRLTWTSAKGAATYVRCGRRDG